MELIVNLIKQFASKTMLIFCMTGATFSVFAADQSEGAIANRIAPVGAIYLDGEIETANTATQSTEPAGPRTADKIYNTYCVACHGTGAAGAPIKGNAEAWAPRIAKGEATLIKHAFEGFNAMPARGTCSDCTDEELTETVQLLMKGM